MNTRQLLFVPLIMTLLFACNKSPTGSQSTKPAVTTAPITSITGTTASSGGTVTSDGGETVTERGVCWSTTPTPLTSHSSTSDGTGEGDFISNITGITVETTYFVRAYAANSEGIAYGNILTFTAMEPAVDIEGYSYLTVKIGSQIWMAENLKVTKYRNGDDIPMLSSPATWMNTSAGAYSSYNNSAANTDTYGYLYNWGAIIDGRGVAPAGWHVANDADWKELEKHLGMTQTEADKTNWRGTSEGGKLKENGAEHWIAPNTADNETGFTALPGGYRDNSGSFMQMGSEARFWTASAANNSNAWTRMLINQYEQIGRGVDSKLNGYSIRCVKD